MPKRRAQKIKPADVPPPSPPAPGPAQGPAPAAVDPDPEPDVIRPPPQQADHSEDTGGDTSDAVSVSPIPRESSPASSHLPRASSTSPKHKKKKQRAKKSEFSLNFAEEDQMLDFIRDNPILWNVKLTDYRRKDKKEKLWQEQAELMDRSSETLQGWFRSLRDTNTRLDKKKSGDPGVIFTQREEWIYTKFAFLKGVTRHRPEPIQSVKQTIQQHRGDLEAAETACAELQVGRDEDAPGTQSSTSSTGRKRQKDIEILQSLEKRVAESGSIIKDFTKAQQQPMTARAAFANYVRDSLMTMPKASYKKARSSINRLLSELMEDSDNDDLPAATATAPAPGPAQQPVHRPRSVPSFGSVDQYHGHVWGTQPKWGHGQFYQYQQMPPPARVHHQQQPNLHHHQPSLQLQQLRQPQASQQQAQSSQPQQSSLALTPILHSSHPSLSKPSPDNFDQSLPSISNLTRFSAMLASPSDLVDDDINTPPSQQSSQ